MKPLPALARIILRADPCAAISYALEVRAEDWVVVVDQSLTLELADLPARMSAHADIRNHRIR